MAQSRMLLLITVLLVSPLTVSCTDWITAPGSVCSQTCTNFLRLPFWTCFELNFPFQQTGTCLVIDSDRGCCAGCASGLLDASEGLAAVLAFVGDIINRLGVFNSFEQGLIQQVLNDLDGIDQFGSVPNILNNVNGITAPNICFWGQQFSTVLWRIIDDCNRILDSFDGRGGVFDDILDRQRLQTVIDLVNWFKQCLLPQVLDLTGLECFKDDMGCDGRHRPYCKPDCRCSECRSNNDCTEPDRPNCRNNRAGIMICGDPHISQTIQGADHRRLCYDFVGKPGSRYLFLRDHEIEIKTTFVEDEDIDIGSFVDYIGHLNVTGKDFNVFITPDQVAYRTSKKDSFFTWKDQSVPLHNGLMAISKKQIQMVFNNGTTEVVVTRKGRAKGTPFLNFGVTEKTGLSSNAGGIMGRIGNEAVFTDDGPHSGYITLADVTIPVYDNKDGCLKIDEAYLSKFGSILHMFELD